jgi:hypothetical protein
VALQTHTFLMNKEVSSNCRLKVNNYFRLQMLVLREGSLELQRNMVTFFLIIRGGMIVYNTESSSVCQGLCGKSICTTSLHMKSSCSA